jgi:hypothetical protein
MTAWVQTTLGPGQAAHIARYMRQARGMGNSNYPRVFMTGSPSHLAMLVELSMEDKKREVRLPA